MFCVCGTDCAGCSHLNVECRGSCQQLKGKIYWTAYIGAEVCPVYRCVAEKQRKNCGSCEKIPCEIWHSLKEPSLTDEEHRQSIRQRVSRLKNSVE